jgi:hypothetical protein
MYFAIIDIPHGLENQRGKNLDQGNNQNCGPTDETQQQSSNHVMTLSNCSSSTAEFAV